MKLDFLARRVQELQARTHRGATPTTTKNGERAWLKHSGIHLWYEATKFRRDTGSLSFDSLPEDLRVQVDLWSRAELDENCGGLAIATRKWAREIMGISEEINEA